MTMTAIPSDAFGQGNYLESDPYESSVAAISRGMRVRRDGSNHNILLALRQLEDPRLRPLFQSLFSSNQPTLQIDALLALAELDGKAIDPFLLQQLQPKERQLALMAAISLDRYDESLIRGVKNFPDLTKVEKTMAVIMGIRVEDTFDRALIDELLQDDEPTTRLIAATLLCDQTGETEALQREVAAFSEMEVSDRILAASALIDIASWHPMPSSLAVLRQTANDDELPRSLRLAAVDSAMGCECEDGIAIWKEATSLARTSGDRSRLGVAAIERGLRTDDWSGISDERQLNQRIARAGASLNDGSDSMVAAQELLKVRHPLSLQATLALADKTDDPEVATAIRLLVIDEAIKDVRIQPVIGRIIRDFGDSPPEQLEAAIWKISRIEGREMLSEILLTALLETNPTQASSYIVSFDEHHDRSVRSLVALIKARGDASLDQESMDELTLVATGGGRVSEQVRAIAGWLWLSRNEKTEEAMTEIIGES